MIINELEKKILQIVKDFEIENKCSVKKIKVKEYKTHDGMTSDTTKRIITKTKGFYELKN